jgi:hypothetical protein
MLGRVRQGQDPAKAKAAERSCVMKMGELCLDYLGESDPGTLNSRQRRSNAMPIRMGIVVANLLLDRAVGQSDDENAFDLPVRLLS